MRQDCYERTSVATNRRLNHDHLKSSVKPQTHKAPVSSSLAGDNVFTPEAPNCPQQRLPDSSLILRGCERAKTQALRHTSRRTKWTQRPSIQQRGEYQQERPTARMTENLGAPRGRARRLPSGPLRGLRELTERRPKYIRALPLGAPNLRERRPLRRGNPYGPSRRSDCSGQTGGEADCTRGSERDFSCTVARVGLCLT